MQRNVTFSAESSLIQRARRRAAEERKTLNEVFREWVKRYAGIVDPRDEYRQLMKRLSHVKPGRPLSREERNAR